jgi:hypothetical protein
LLVSLAALRSTRWPRALSYLGLLISAAGLLTSIPALQELGAAFGLGLIAWFVGLGWQLLRGHRQPVLGEPTYQGSRSPL